MRFYETMTRHLIDTLTASEGGMLLREDIHIVPESAMESKKWQVWSGFGKREAVKKVFNGCYFFHSL
jgi:hypothetical protein